jgi:hypothetical protein
VVITSTSPLKFVEVLMDFGKGSPQVLAVLICDNHLRDEVTDTHHAPMGFLLNEDVVFLLQSRSQFTTAGWYVLHGSVLLIIIAATDPLIWTATVDTAQTGNLLPFTATPGAMLADMFEFPTPRTYHADFGWWFTSIQDREGTLSGTPLAHRLILF